MVGYTEKGSRDGGIGRNLRENALLVSFAFIHAKTGGILGGTIVRRGIGRYFYHPFIFRSKYVLVYVSKF